MSINPVWGETYSISEAERGRFVPLDMSTTTQYPTSGRGKFALLTYDVGTNSTAISSSGGISTAVTVISTAPTLVNTTQNYSNNTFTTVVSTITFNPIIQNIENFNKSGNYAYISWNAIGFSGSATAASSAFSSLSERNVASHMSKSEFSASFTQFEQSSVSTMYAIFFPSTT